VLAFLARPPPGTPPPIARALWSTIPSARRRSERDQLLRRAAELLPGPPWTKAKALARLTGPARRPREHFEPDLSTVAGCVAAAMLASPQASGRGLSSRQIHRLLGCDTGPLKCQRTRSQA
jgi:hypothetical protein